MMVNMKLRYDWLVGTTWYADIFDEYGVTIVILTIIRCSRAAATMVVQVFQVSIDVQTIRCVYPTAAVLDVIRTTI